MYVLYLYCKYNNLYCTLHIVYIIYTFILCNLYCKYCIYNLFIYHTNVVIAWKSKDTLN